MFIHSVYFWLKPELTTEQVAAFKEGLRSLATIETVKMLHFGTPAETDRAIIDRSYSYGMVVDLGDQEGHDAYQVDPIHLAFVQNFAPYWTQVKVYDFS